MQGRSGFLLQLPNDIGKLASLGTRGVPGVPQNVYDPETIEFADLLGTIAEDQHSTRCAQVCFAGTEKDQS